MADRSKVSDRDQTLINILERIAGEFQKQDVLLESIAKNQSEFSKTSLTAERKFSVQQEKYEKAYDKIRESITGYRSNMLSLVNEQDRINDGMKDLRKMISGVVFSLESTNKRLADLDERVKAQDKALSAHFEHSMKQDENLKRDVADAGHNVAKLHADTDKRLGELQQDIHHQLEKLQQDTTRRLLVLGEIELAMQTLLIRTEPPEKKKFLFSRVFLRIGFFFRVTLPHIARKIMTGKINP
jgi:chromosome segregation ATPase